VKSYKQYKHYHSYEYAKFWIHFNRIAIGEEEGFPLFLFGGQDDSHLLGSHRQNRKFDAVKLIKASPTSGLS